VGNFGKGLELIWGTFLIFPNEVDAILFFDEH